MRLILAGLVILASVAGLAAEAPPAKRFGVEADLKSFPQATPQEALASVLKAIDLKRPDYIIAQLADPQFVDRRVEETSHDEMLAELTAKLLSDPGAAKALRNFQKDGEWTVGDTTASASLKEGGDRTVSFRKAGGRWFLEQPYRKPMKKTERE